MDRVPEGDENDDASSFSSAASMGRQMTELTDADCTDIMERQCSNFRTRDESFWLRQCTTPAERLNAEVLVGMKRQISAPSSSTTMAFTGPGSMNTLGEDSVCGQPLLETNDAQTDQCDIGLIETAISTVVSESHFCVAAADPDALDCELIAVSEGFVRMTGYSREEVIGENCRFLNNGCPQMPEEQRSGLQRAVETGSPFVGVLVNKRQDGQLFLNFLDLRGLVIAQNVDTGEELWIMLAVSLDVTHEAPERLPANQLPVLRQVAGRIRKRFVKTLGELGLSAAMVPLSLRSNALGRRSKSECLPTSTETAGRWHFTSEATWRAGEVPAPVSADVISSLKSLLSESPKRTLQSAAGHPAKASVEPLPASAEHPAKASLEPSPSAAGHPAKSSVEPPCKATSPASPGCVLVMSAAVSVGVLLWMRHRKS